MKAKLRCTPEECSRIEKKATQLHQALKDPATIAEQARIFQALGNEMRLKILGLLAVQELCVCDILARVGGAPSTIAHHLRTLEAAKVIGRREEGKFTLYAVNVGLLRKHRLFE
ncbi:MAG TPA: metalloregulator ArsR/SmtB family transcription factor [Candidatus Sulfotelmatobacter sp.]|nr:metalloregulator ArsR/SmtB family transcription factor [Candidatus Sulfotelmatobacter sp.]HEV2487150.1 metalloregulator ArsR/SmtB family transcription factor [Terracidiphilus sp.]